MTESLCSIVASSDRVYCNRPSSFALSKETFTGSLDSWFDNLCVALCASEASVDLLVAGNIS